MITACPQEVIERVQEYFHYRFGVTSSVFTAYQLYSGPHGRVFLGPHIPFDMAIDTAGLLIARVHRTVKPTSDFFQLFGQYVRKNIVPLPRKYIPAFCRGEVIELDTAQLQNVTRGFVMVSYTNLPLGCGLVKGTILESQVPKRNQLPLQYW